MTSSLTAALILTCLLALAEGQQSYDYKQALNLSLLFFEAQRAGHLPADNRVPWRGDSCTQDRGDNGEDLTGGYFTQGTTATFIFPNAAATTLLAWGLLDFEDAYLSADLRERGEEAIKWGADHLAKCHTKDDELYVMFGDPHYWGHPEAFVTSRTALHISQSKPGAEVAAEAAAALAASAMILPSNLRDTRDSYIRHARQLYQFAHKYRGKYHDSVQEAADFYKSWSGFQDELVWAAVWLYRLTNEQTYLIDAQALYNDFMLQTKDIDEFSWDNKLLGLKALLYKITLDEKYKNAPKEHCDKLSSGYKKTPKGMYYFGSEIGSIKYALASAFICLSFGETLVDINQLSNNPYQDFALRQLHYALGSTGRSYVVGFGTSYPRFPYHRGASCQPYPADCTWDAVKSTSPNPTEILGALVGGPDQNDAYQDTRDWKQNGVTVYQNAALQSLLAAVKSLLDKGKLDLEVISFGSPDYI